MKKFKYLIIGGGMTTKAAIDGIRSLDKDGTIGIISEEKYEPYERPPLTKGLWNETKLDDIFLDVDKTNVTFHLNTIAIKIDREKKIVIDNEGEEYQYTELLIATGASPRRISEDSDRIIYYRYLRDYEKLKELLDKYTNFGVIGGGFIGSEIAAALTNSEKRVTMFFMEKGVGGLIFPDRLSTHLNKYYETHGVFVLPETSVGQIHEVEDEVRIRILDKEYSFDAVIIGIGVHPNVELLEPIDIDLENGVKVDKYLRTSDPHIFAAGDVANFYSPDLGKRIRVEHEDNAYMQGEIAGKNMAGANEEYTHLPFFYSDLYDYGYEAIGILNSKLNTVEDWKDEFDQGIVYYLEDDVVVGVLLWNTWDQVNNARSLIASKKKMKKEDLIGYMPK